ncbi:MAG: hypothetical protein WDO19_21250 [Bacteroidota bacterium]
MKKLLTKEVLSAFSQDNGTFHVEQLGNGLINHTFKISDNISGKALLLQQINKNVFKNPADVQDNYLKLWNIKTELKKFSFLPLFI